MSDNPQVNMAEMAVVGSLLVDASKAAPFLVDNMEPERFEHNMLRATYEKALSMFVQNGYVDSIPLLDSLSKDYDKADVKVILAQCVQELGSVRALPSYVKILNDHYKARELSRLCRRFSLPDLIDVSTVDEQLEEVITGINNLLRGNKRKGLIPISDIVLEQYSRLFDKESLKGNVRSGFFRLDYYTKGFRKKQLVILAARPGVGKSALALNWSLAFARQGKRTALFSMEMSKEELFERYMANMAPVNLGVIQDRDAGADTAAKLARATSEISKLPLMINDEGTQTVEQIRMAAKLKQVDVVIVDYLQLIHSAGRSNSRNEEVGRISRSLKQMAMDLDIPVIALSQLNRQKNEDMEPSLSNLRDSGEIEQDANMVIFLWETDIRSTGSEQYLACKVAKIRNGIRGEVVLKYIGGTMSFEETDKKVPRSKSRESKRKPWQGPDDFVEVDDPHVF